MLIHKVRFTIVTLLAFAAFATGAGFLTHSLAMKDEPKRTPAASQPPLAAKSNSPCSGPDVRGRPRARPGGQAGAGRNRDGSRAGQAVGECRRSRRIESSRDRPRGRRRIGPVSPRRPPNVVVAER